jgi:hypothetical protein
MSRARWGLLAVVIIAVIAGLAGRASATLESDNNGCSASGIFREIGLEVDAAAIGDTVVVIPRSDVVDWQGSVAAPPGAYSGSISVELPPPFGEVEFHSWSGDSDTLSSAGDEDYDLPWLVPAGVEFQVSGSHTDENGTCSGFVNLEIDGGPFDSLAAPISLVGTVATGAGLLATIRPLFRRGSI